MKKGLSDNERYVLLIIWSVIILIYFVTDIWESAGPIKFLPFLAMSIYQLNTSKNTFNRKSSYYHTQTPHRKSYYRRNRTHPAGKRKIEVHRWTD